jgi:hypothetical protein
MQGMRSKKGGSICLNILHGFLVDAFNQVFGSLSPRPGKLRLTRYGLQRMHEYQLDINTLEDTFRRGEEVKKEMIIRKYRDYSVGLT